MVQGAPKPGDTLGRYELIAEIGQGGMAAVHLARQLGPKGFAKLVVVKTIHPQLAKRPQFVEMLLEEARIAALIKHPNVVDIYDLGEAAGHTFIAMEYLDGEPLLALLRAGKEGKPLAHPAMARIFADCSAGLHAAHELRGMDGERLALVHHDVSPGNIVILFSGGVKLVDFGVANAGARSDSDGGDKRLMKGKLGYMAPEKLRGAPGDCRADIFSLGVAFWEALTLRRLFRGEDKAVSQAILEGALPTPQSLVPSVPASLDAIVMRCLERDPDVRYPTAKALGDAIEDALSELGHSRRADTVAAYMNATFSDRRAQRERLIREVAANPRAADAAVLEELFTRPSLPNRSTPVPTTPPPLPVPVVVAPTVEVASAPSPSPVAAAGDLKTTETSGERGGVVDAETWFQRSEAIDSAKADSTGMVPRRRARWPLAAAGGALLIGAIVVGRGACRGTPATQPAPGVASGRVPVDAAPAPIPYDATAVDAAAPVDAAPPIDAATVAPPIDAAPGTVKPPKPERTAQDLYRDGMQALVKSDPRAAVRLFKQANRIDAGFAPAWRGLGLAAERAGDSAQATKAFRRYLQLAPKASDADTIRKRLEGT